MCNYLALDVQDLSFSLLFSMRYSLHLLLHFTIELFFEFGVQAFRFQVCFSSYMLMLLLGLRGLVI